MPLEFISAIPRFWMWTVKVHDKAKCYNVGGSLDLWTLLGQDHIADQKDTFLCLSRNKTHSKSPLKTNSPAFLMHFCLQLVEEELSTARGMDFGRWPNTFLYAYLEIASDRSYYALSTPVVISSYRKGRKVNFISYLFRSSTYWPLRIRKSRITIYYTSPDLIAQWNYFRLTL